jgi:hypothetical protein
MKPDKCKSCDGTSSELRRRVLGNGAVQIVYQCLTCGRSACNPLAKASVPKWQSLPVWDDALAANYDQFRAEVKAERKEEWFAEHDEYLRSSKWRSLRDRVIERCSGVCEGCARRAVTQVHHLTYEHWKDELLWELVGVCDDCHERAHAKQATIVIGKPQ